VAAEVNPIKSTNKRTLQRGYILLFLLRVVRRNNSGQVARLEAKSAAAETAEEARRQYASVLIRANEMVESIKQAIVLLQIAKNAAAPDEPGAVKEFNGAIDALTKSGRGEGNVIAVNEVGEMTGNKLEDSRSGGEEKAVTKAPDTATASGAIGAAATATGHLKPDKKSAIPEISYSSSDDDDFYDAEDQEDEEDRPMPSSSPQSSQNPPSDLDISSQPPAAVEPINSPLTPTDDDEGVDYDALYEAADDDEDVDMKNHGSVLTHLLSQVRIGMDLTKIVLPTFILERRSLLEMYSDFFAHPDIFLSVTDGKSPEERMTRVLRWYLSSFHAGRQSSVAKKPYNPILGETFRCHWKVDEDDGDGPYKDGILPWCSRSDLTFVAEQVSHHPPISAFYAEHAKKRMSVNAHIYTKSSFLGMSIAVHNVGQGKLTLMDHNEEYICTFPSAYGRSILTVPWVELGGKVSITCPQTNYHANIEFKCKQFFSSDVNKVSAEVMAPGNKKPVLKVDGEWNGKMMAKWATGKNEVFIDVAKTAIHPKVCRKVAEQGRFESRRLWKDVTYNLKINDIDAATVAKSGLEHRQRTEAAERKEKNVKWETKLFQPIGENWQFMNPLEKRLMEEGAKK